MNLEDYPRVGDWLGLREGRLLVRSGKVDIGQRISTAMRQIAREELTLPQQRIDVAQVRTGSVPDEGITSGSNSVEQSGNAIRRAAATLREALLHRVVAQYGGRPGDWRLEDGALTLPATNHRLDLLEIVTESDFEAHVDRDAPPLSTTGATPRAPMHGIERMVSGRFTYVHDLIVPGMQHARVVRPPHVHARLHEIPEAALERLGQSGIRIIRDGSFLAVVGPREWPVVEGAARLAGDCSWDLGDGLPEEDIFARLTTAGAERLQVVDGTPQTGPAPEPLRDPSLSARFERPYQMHGALGPSAALASWDGARLRVQCHSQGIYPLRTAIADSLGLTVEQVEIAHVPGSGCYGHNGADDAAFDAALVAMASPGVPILLKWSRADEHGWEPYAPAMAVELAARLEGGRVMSFSAEAISDTHRGRPRPGADRAGPAKLLSNRFREAAIGPRPATPNMGHHAGMHRNLDPIYDFPKKRLVKNLVAGLAHRTSAMRTLGAAANVFAIESFMDELARRSGADPLAFRQAHLSDRHAGAVLDRLRQEIATLPDLTEGQGRGIAYGQYKNAMTRVGVAVDLVVSDRAAVTLLRAVLVADAGRVVDADGLEAQLEGGFLQGASWALCEEVRWDRDGILTRDWESYPVLRFDNVPEFRTVILDHPAERSLGAGEASPGPAVAAIANAIFAAVGVRMRRMPFTAEEIRNRASR